jgi:glycosyltransferase involved in cell wall biosynthesis
MKALIVEEALKSLHGHWFQYISDIVSGGEEAGHNIEVAVHKDACKEILKSFPSRPILHSTVFEKQASTYGKWAGLNRAIAHNYSLYCDLSDWFAAGNSYDVVIATTTRLDHLPAYFCLYWRFRNRAFKRLVLMFIESLGTYNSDYSQVRFVPATLPLRIVFLFSRLLLPQRQLFWVTESTELAREYEKFCGIKFALVPHVTRMPSLEPHAQQVRPPSPSTPKTMVFGTYGFSRYDKGMDILQDAIKIVLQQPQCPDIRFIVQWTGDYRLPDETEVRKDPALEKDPRVHYLPAFEHSRDYYKWLAQTDVMILPYRRAFYFNKLSRIAIDAALAGLPFLYPQGTWMESFAREGRAGVPFQAEDPASLAKAILKAAAQHPQLKAIAQANVSSTVEAFSARRFFEIIGSLPHASSPSK